MTELPFDRRRAGLLVPVFAMRHSRDFGIGDTRAVREAIDFCAEHRFKVLQMLPIQETFGDPSPYNPISSRALSPAYVYLDPEAVPGLLPSNLERAAPEAWLEVLRSGVVRHGSVHALKIHILMDAWREFRSSADPGDWADFQHFVAEESSWLDDYTLYRVLVREYEGNTDWADWRPEHQSRSRAQDWLMQHPEREGIEMLRSGFAYIQWVASRQWTGVREHAESAGVMLMGEVSFGVGRGSADVWANRDLFDLDWNMGTRPLVHFDTSKDAERWGQNWGLPVYRWENHRSTGYQWLRSRVAGQRKYFHLCRLDHLRGYFRIYMFPWPGGPRHAEYSNLNADEAALRNGGKLPRFVPGPDEDASSAAINEAQGRELLAVIQDEAREMGLVAELMGEMPEYMERVLEDLQLANLTFPQLHAVGDELREWSLITYANHDNAPLRTSYRHLVAHCHEDPSSREAEQLHALLSFCGWKGDTPDELSSDLLAALQNALFRAPCRLAVLMSSDLIGVDTRFNLPGSYGIETWCERLEFPFSAYDGHGIYGPRIRSAVDSIMASGRG